MIFFNFYANLYICYEYIYFIPELKISESIYIRCQKYDLASRVDRI